MFDTKALVLWAVEKFRAHPYGFVFFGLLSCGLGVPLPEEVFLVMSGYVSYLDGIQQLPDLFPMLVVTWLAIGGGDFIAFSAGRRWGGRVFQTALMKRLVSDSGRAKAEEFLMRYGNRTIFAARFLPGIRMPTYLLCGTLGVRAGTFLFWDAMAMLISVPTQVILTWHYGSVLDEALQYVKKLNRGFLCLSIVVALVVYAKMHSGAGVPTDLPVPDKKNEEPPPAA